MKKDQEKKVKSGEHKKGLKKKKVRVYLKGINPEVWEHPADRIALKAVKQVKGLDQAIQFFFGATTEKSIHLITLASALRVSKKQFSRILDLHVEACKILDMDSVPELYISQNPFLNAGAIGIKKPFITLNSSLVETLNDSELLYVIGHELSHIKSGHVLYKTLLRIVMSISSIMINIPLSGLILIGIIAALKEWDRKSELSADRAALLTVQDPEVGTHVLMKMAGGNFISEMNLGEFIKQAEEYNKSESISDSIYKFLNTLGESHPFHVVRVLEQINWVRSGNYENIIKGFYKKMEKDFSEDFKQAADSYKDEIEDSLKPLKKIYEETTKKVRDFLK